MSTKEAAERPKTRNGRFDITFPSAGNGVDQDEEWCQVVLDGEPRRIRFHDYGDIYDVPGLYEQLFYHELRCQSPAVVCGLLDELLRADDYPAEGLRVLDVGAGNGMVGEELSRLGVETIVGVDIIREAAEATDRDRPGLYADYVVTDLTAMPARVRRKLERHQFNCLTSVAALGFGDIPPLAFAEAYNMVSDGGWIAFCIRDRFLEDGEESGFNRLVRWMLENHVMDIRTKRRYRHRLSIHGEPLHYQAVVATKHADVSLDWARQAG